MSVSYQRQMGERDLLEARSSSNPVDNSSKTFKYICGSKRILIQENGHTIRMNRMSSKVTD